MRTLRMYCVAKLNHYGHNAHGFWTGSFWSADEEMAVLYASQIEAQLEIDRMSDKADVTMIRTDIKV
jgi:hypothetical protein